MIGGSAICVISMCKMWSKLVLDWMGGYLFLGADNLLKTGII